jgi:hypothetical protein
MTIAPRLLLCLLLTCACQRGGAPRAQTSEDVPRDSSPTGGVSGSLVGSRTELSPGVAPSPAVTWQSFVQAWNSGDAQALRPFQARLGLVALDNPGAFVRLRHLSTMAEIRALEGEHDLARLKHVTLRALLQSGDAPKANCETDVRLSGTFVTQVDRVLVEKRFAALREYQLATEDELKKLEPSVQAAKSEAAFAVYDLDANVGFLFGKEEGRFVLLAIDAVIPCSA